MPFLISNPELEAKLNQHAKQQAVPTTKGRLAIAIIKAAIQAADDTGIDAGQIIRQLSKNKSATHAIAA